MIDITSPAVLLIYFLSFGLFLSIAFLYISLKREADLFVQKCMVGTIITYGLFLVGFVVWSYAV
jgi:hypothetical protein